MSKRLRWTLIGLSSLAFLAGFASLRLGKAQRPDPIARTLLRAWQANGARVGSAVLWDLPPVTDMPGYDLSVGKVATGRGIATLQKRSHWCSLGREHAYALLQSEANQQVWQLSESRWYTVMDHTVWRGSSVLTIITNLP